MTLSGDATRLLAAEADPAAAGRMATYMKTEMPFFGVMADKRRSILRQLVATHPVDTNGQYRRDVRDLWHLANREEKYLAIGWARHHRRFVTSDNIDLYEVLIVEGAWWDFVDDVAIHLVGRVYGTEPDVTEPVLDGWVVSDVMWLRRAAIICQVGAKDDTRFDALSRYILSCVDEREFFIRKAIGWALRDLSKHRPDDVRRFVDQYRERLSGLSLREATKYL